MGLSPYPDLNDVLGELLSGAQNTLGTQFVGLYLHGSLAAGDFDSAHSDVDVVIVTADRLPAELLAALAAMHDRLGSGGSKWGREIEASYIPREALRRHDPADAVYPRIQRGQELRLEWHGSDWVIQRHMLREQAVAVAGPPLTGLIDPVRPEELRTALVALNREWWWPMVDDPASPLRDRGYQIYAILTMCRILYTLHHGAVVSKAAAGRWARDGAAKRWAGEIERALRHDMTADDLIGARELIRYADEAVRAIEPRREGSSSAGR